MTRVERAAYVLAIVRELNEAVADNAMARSAYPYSYGDHLPNAHTDTAIERKIITAREQLMMLTEM